ncbi:Plasmodium exported protein (Pm-fam-a like), unknown function, partial [Plasmodium malariae]
LDENYNLGKTLVTRTYRILVKYKYDKDSVTERLKEHKYKCESNEKKCITNNEKKTTENKKELNRCSSINTGVHKQLMNNKTCIFETKKYSKIEKKIFKELDYIDFLEKNRTISDKTFRKAVFKKCRVRIVLPLFMVLLLSTYLILDSFCSCGLIKWLLVVLKENIGAGWSRPLHDFLDKLNLDILWISGCVGKEGAKRTWTFITIPFLYYVIYCMPLFIIGVTIILYIIYYHKKVKKYQNIKFRKR